MCASHELRLQPDVSSFLGLIATLLIAAMVIAPALLPCEPNLPAASDLPTRRGPPGDTLWIDRDGNYYFNKRLVRYTALASALSHRPEDRPLYVFADRGIDYELVQDAFDVARRSGNHYIGLLARPTPPAGDVARSTSAAAAQLPE